MNWNLLICCLLGLFFVAAIEARCLQGTGNMWQQKPPADSVTSCKAPSLLHSDEPTSATAGAAPKTATAEAAGEAMTDPPAVTLANSGYLYASMASTCSNQAPKLGPESKPESSHPEWECKQELKAHELPKPEVPKRRTVTLTASDMEAVRLRWREYLNDVKETPSACKGRNLKPI